MAAASSDGSAPGPSSRPTFCSSCRPSIRRRAGLCGPLVTKGQAYVFSRTGPVGVSAQDDAAERRWHLIAVGVLQQRLMGEQIVGYVDVLHTRRPLPANAAVWDPRVNLARGIGQEQVCRRIHATARNDRLLSEFEGKAATPPAMRQMAIECMAEGVPLSRGCGRTRRGARRSADARRFRSVSAGEERATPERRSTVRVAAPIAPLPTGARSSSAAYLMRSARTPTPSAHIRMPCGSFPMRRPRESALRSRSSACVATMTPTRRCLAARRVRADGVDPWESYFEGDGDSWPAGSQP